jgi:hypothetical protein
MAPAKPGTNGHGSRHLLIAFNPEVQGQTFTLPPGHWQVALDSAGELALGSRPSAASALNVPAQALVVLRDASGDA